MFYDLSKFRGGVDRIDRQYEPAAFRLTGEEFRLAGPVSLSAEVQKDARKVRIAGHLTATLECDCSRCLEPFPIGVDAALDVMFLPADQNVGVADREVGEDDLGVAFYRNDEIDLGELMREQFYVALPMKPLCHEDCRGLCPVCGINRNRETCSCRTEWVDPRMEALRKLKR